MHPDREGELGEGGSERYHLFDLLEDVVGEVELSGMSVFAHMRFALAACECCCDARLVQDPRQRELGNGRLQAISDRA